MGIDGRDDDPDADDERRRGNTPGGSGLQEHRSEALSRQEYYDSLVSGQSSEAGVFRPWTTAKPAIERLEWQAPLDEGSVERVGLGVIDERAKKFSSAERRIAEYLASGGPAVVYEEGSDPYLRAGTVAVYVGGHEFDDDDIAWPEGPEIPLHSEFPVMIETRDPTGDPRRQQEVADKIFTALRTHGHWPVVYIDDMQKVLDHYEPV